MAGLLSGLDAYGLKDLETMEIYEKKKGQSGEASVKQQPPQAQEQEFLFDKSWTCPACNEEFKARTVKVGKAKLIGADLDLRPKYEQIDMLKYDVVMCPYCGYTALSRFFKFLTVYQKNAIEAKISKTFKPQTGNKIIYTYEEALERYKMALVNAIVKGAKPSEKGYICLKTAWLLRGQGESLSKSDPEYEKKKKEISEQEDEFISSAMEGFLAARQTEEYPLCGMDEATVDYLLATMAMRSGQYDLASRLVSGVMTSREVNPRMKEKARVLKEMIVKKIRETSSK